MDETCAFCKESKLPHPERYLLIPHPICFICMMRQDDVKVVSFRSSRPAECVKEIDNYSLEACKLYVNVSSEADILKLSDPETIINKKISEYSGEKALKDDSIPKSKTLSSLAVEDPQDLSVKKNSENPEEDFGLQISDHSKDLVTSIAETIDDEQGVFLERQSNIELEMAKRKREAAIELDGEEPIPKLERLKVTSKNIELEEVFRDSVASSNNEQQQQQQKEASADVTSRNTEQKPSRDIEITHMDHKLYEDFEEPPKLYIPFAGDADSSYDGREFLAPESLTLFEDEIPIDMCYSKFVRDKENVLDLFCVANNPAYMEELASIETRLNDCINELKEMMLTIDSNKSGLEFKLNHIKKITPPISAEKFRFEINCIHSYISEAESQCGMRFIKNVTISLANLNKEEYLNKIYKILISRWPVYAVHHIDRKQVFGQVTLKDENILVHSVSIKSINRSFATVWFKDIKKCFTQKEDALFIMYCIPSEGSTMEFIEPTENPLSQQFIKLCTGECGPTYKDASLNKPKNGEEVRGSYPEIEVSEYMLNEQSSQGPIDYYVGNSWISCHPKERVAIGSKNGAFRIARVGDLAERLISVVGKVRYKKGIRSDEYLNVQAKTEQCKRQFIKECGLALKMVSAKKI